MWSELGHVDYGQAPGSQMWREAVERSRIQDRERWLCQMATGYFRPLAGVRDVLSAWWKRLTPDPNRSLTRKAREPKLIVRTHPL